MEYRKIALACFIGGALCSLVALLFAPAFWYLGIFAGLAGGYLGYEFREVVRAVPVALRAARGGAGSHWQQTTDGWRKFVSETHPFLFLAGALAMPLYYWGAFHVVPAVITSLNAPSLGLMILITILMMPMGLEVFGIMTALALIPVTVLSFIGAHYGERCFWWPFLDHTKQSEKEARELEAQGFRRESATYWNVARWFARGVGFSLKFFVWTAWKHLTIYLGRFLWHLFKLIHSEKRVLCSLDGTIGGVVSYFWLADPSFSLVGIVVVVMFGGILGAAWGVLNYELVSKRWLRVAQA